MRGRIRRHQLPERFGWLTWTTPAHPVAVINPCTTNNGGCGKQTCTFNGPGLSTCGASASASTATLAVGVGVGVGMFVLVMAIIFVAILIARESRRPAPVSAARPQWHRATTQADREFDLAIQRLGPDPSAGSPQYPLVSVDEEERV